jgi:hypothetical protein
MQVFNRPYTAVPKQLFAGNSDLKLGPWAVEMDDVPVPMVQQALQDVERSGFYSYLSDLPQSFSLRIFRHPQQRQFLVLEVKGLPAGIEPYSLIRKESADHISGTIKEALGHLSRMKREGKFADIS